MKYGVGFALTIDVVGTIEEYALAFLAISNVVRENDELLEVKNYQSNYHITVIGKESLLEKMHDWLRQFGNIVLEEKLMLVELDEVDVDFDFDEYDDLYYYIEG